MSEIALRNDQPAELATIADQAVARLSSWAAAASATHQMAQTLVQTSFVPQAFRGKPMEATAAILAGAEIGLNPMASLRSFDVIQGTAAPRANTLRAVVQGAGHQIRLVESSDTRAIVEGCRRGEGTWQRSVWTIDRAKRLNLTSKENWKNQPQAMLVARATSECCRLIASDAILGIPYSSEELVDGDGDSGFYGMAAAPSEPAAKPKTRKMSRNQEADPEPTVDEPAVEMINPEQMSLLQVLFKEKGILDREERLRQAAEVVGRELGSANELTKAEAHQVIDWLKAPVVEAEPVADEPGFDDDAWLGGDKAAQS